MGMLDEIKARQAAKQASQATGSASSADVGIDALVSKVEKSLDKSAVVTEELVAPVEIPEGAYIANRLRQFYLADGTKVEPTNGFYVPKCEEEQQMLEYYASKGVVEYNKRPE